LVYFEQLVEQQLLLGWQAVLVEQQADRKPTVKIATAATRRTLFIVS